MLAFAEWRDLYKAGKLSGPQLQFFESKPVEQLFDTEADPHEINNLASNPRYANVLKDLRARLATQLRALPDLSFYPESKLVSIMDDPVGFGLNFLMREMGIDRNAVTTHLHEAETRLDAAMQDRGRELKLNELYERVCQHSVFHILRQVKCLAHRGLALLAKGLAPKRQLDVVPPLHKLALLPRPCGVIFAKILQRALP